MSESLYLTFSDGCEWIQCSALNRSRPSQLARPLAVQLDIMCCMLSSNSYGSISFWIYSHFASHMFPEVCGCGIGENRDEQTLHSLSTEAHSSDKAPLVRNLRRSAFACDALEEPLLCRYTTFFVWLCLLQKSHRECRVIISVPLTRCPNTVVSGIVTSTFPMD